MKSITDYTYLILDKIIIVNEINTYLLILFRSNKRKKKEIPYSAQYDLVSIRYSKF